MNLKIENHTIIICVLLAIGSVVGKFGQAQTPSTNSFDAKKLETQIKQVVQLVRPATIAIATPDMPEMAVASGVIVSQEGHILTAGHCVREPGSPVTILLPDGREFPGIGLGVEPDLDCGMIKIDDEALIGVKLPTVKLGWSSDLVVDQPCISLGHSGGHNKERGAVVRFGRIAETISSNNGMIRSTCLMEPGDSGGPLFDLKGRLIGIHSMIYAELDDNYEVPVDLFRCYWKQLVSSEKFRVGRNDEFPNLGLRLQRDASMLKILGMQSTNKKKTVGAKLTSVTKDGWAASQGLKNRDRILKYNGVEVHGPGQLNLLFCQSIVLNKEASLEVKRRNSESLTFQLDFSNFKERDSNEMLAYSGDAGERPSPVPQLTLLPEQFADAESKLDDFCVGIKSVLDGEPSETLGTAIRFKNQTWVIGKSTLIGDAIQLSFEGQKPCPATLVVRDEANDLAVLKVKADISIGITKNQCSGEETSLLASWMLSPHPKNCGEVSVLGAGPFSTSVNGFLGITPGKGENGAKIADLVPDGPAEKADLRVGDIIFEVDGKPIASPVDLITLLSKRASGDRLLFKFKRSDKNLEKQIELGGRPLNMMEDMHSFHIADDFEGGKSRLRTGFPRLYVHDGHVLPEECGGPVFNHDQKFVGLNIARFSRTQTYLLPAKEVFELLESTTAATRSNLATGDQQ